MVTQKTHTLVFVFTVNFIKDYVGMIDNFFEFCINGKGNKTALISFSAILFEIFYLFKN